MNEPKMLFLECLHYCVCLECEEANPFQKCPFCKRSIETKLYGRGCSAEICGDVRKGY